MIMISDLEISQTFDNDYHQNIIDIPDQRKLYRLRRLCNLPQLVYFQYFYQFPWYQNQVKQTLKSYLKPRLKFQKFILIDVTIEFIIDNWNLAMVTHIDTKWCYRIQYLVTLKMDLEESLSWLSTLGGACSALGDKNINFAKQAELISWSQMRLSFIYGDPNLVARCLIYLSHSWSQQGHRRRAIKLVKNYLHPFLVRLGKNCDLIVKRMYQALCFRIRYIYK